MNIPLFSQNLYGFSKETPNTLKIFDPLKL